LQALAEALSADLFFQANRGDLVNLEWLAEIEQVLDQSYDLILRDSHRTRVPVSRRRLSRLRELLHF
ncbi:MAG: LytTR family transcriptional regulator DNA-binding domain-containing protein, partial [Dehalococcoidia bacterium]